MNCSATRVLFSGRGGARTAPGTSCGATGSTPPAGGAPSSTAPPPGVSSAIGVPM